MGKRRIDLPSRFSRYIVLLVLGLISTISVHLVGFNPPDADVRYDWLVAREAWRSQGDAYQPILNLAEAEGLSLRVNLPHGADEAGLSHPRTPGALLLMTPLAAVPPHLVFALAFGANMAMLLVVCFMSIGDRPARNAFALFLLSLATMPVFTNFRFAGQALVVAILTLLGWKLASRGIYWGAVLIGIAAVFKLFPLILLVPLIRRGRSREAWVAGVTFLLVNISGSAMPGVSVVGSIETLSSARTIWYGLLSNASIFRPLAHLLGPDRATWALAFSVIAGGWLLYRSKSATEPFVWLSLGLVALPISWSGYSVILMPAIAALIWSKRDAEHLVGVFVLSIWMMPLVIFPWVLVAHGPLTLIATCCLALVLVGAGGVRNVSARTPWTQQGKVRLHLRGPSTPAIGNRI